MEFLGAALHIGEVCVKRTLSLSLMLFILAMDVMGFLVSKAKRRELLQPLSSRTLQHRVSFYANDMVLFLRPVVDDIAIIMDILELFGEASGLRNNV
jgi:hypothetical protein